MAVAPKARETCTQFDRARREQLLLDQLPQVHYIARRIRERLPQHVALEDLINAGVLGLIEALEKYDPAKNIQFSSYARFRIRGAILDSLREMDWSPRSLRKKARQLEEAESKLRLRLGRPITEPELAEELGISLEQLHHLLGELRGLTLCSLQTETSEHALEPDANDRLANTADEDPFLLCWRSEMSELLARAVGELPPRERQMLALYYLEDLTMKEIGVVLGVGEARVSQIHSAAMIRLRARMRELLAPSPWRRRAAPRGAKPLAGLAWNGATGGAGRALPSHAASPKPD